MFPVHFEKLVVIHVGSDNAVLVIEKDDDDDHNVSNATLTGPLRVFVNMREKLFNKSRSTCFIVGSYTKDGKEMFCLPGGKRELGETWFQCVKRETEEETSIDVEKEMDEGVHLTDSFAYDGMKFGKFTVN